MMDVDVLTVAHLEVIAKLRMAPQARRLLRDQTFLHIHMRIERSGKISGKYNIGVETGRVILSPTNALILVTLQHLVSALATIRRELRLSGNS
jgi:hypothetical protein